MAKPTAAMTSNAAAVDKPAIIGNESSGGVAVKLSISVKVGEIETEMGDRGGEGEGDEGEREEGEGDEGEGDEGGDVGQTAIKHDKMSERMR